MGCRRDGRTQPKTKYFPNTRDPPVLPRDCHGAGDSAHRIGRPHDSDMVEVAWELHLENVCRVLQGRWPIQARNRYQH